MSSPEVLDFAPLLAPIPGDSPTGVDLRGDSSPNSPYYGVRDARKAAACAEWAQVVGEAGGDSGPPAGLAARPAARRTGAEPENQGPGNHRLRDRVLLRLHGFAGLRDGFRLARDLIDLYWEGLYPRPDEDGVAGQVAALASLNGVEGDGTLQAPIHRVAITHSTSVGSFTFSHYRDALALGKVADSQAREDRVARGAITLEVLERAVAETPPAFYQTLVEDLTQCQEQFERLCSALSDRCGADAPPSGQIRAALEDCLGVVRVLAKDKLQAAGQAPAPTAEGADAPATAGAPRAARPATPCAPGKTLSAACCRSPSSSARPNRTPFSLTPWSKRFAGAGCRCPNCLLN